MNCISQSPALADRRSRIARMLSPRSVAIIGMSTRERSAGHMVLRNLLANDFAGDIHLVGRGSGEIEGLPIGTDIAAIPAVDVAVLTLPASAVAEALQACADREIGAAIVFASGFAEAGVAARANQEALGKRLGQAGLSVVGPNCIGYTNYRSGFMVGFTGVSKLERLPEGASATAIIAQSGGLASHLRLGLRARGVPVSYSISTGNEMDLCIADFVDHLVDDDATRAMMLYVEHVKEPDRFRAAVLRARAAGKAVVMLHPGRSKRAQEAAQSHTGSLASDHAVMRCHVERAGATVVDTLDELLDTTELLCRFPQPSPGGLGIMTFSGAFCGIALDFCDDAGIDVPLLSKATVDALAPKMPPFIEPHNPLDLGTQPLWQPELVGVGLEALLAEPAIGGVAISIPAGSPQKGSLWIEEIARAIRRHPNKPVGLALLGDTSPLPPEIEQRARDNNLVLIRSSDRLLRAMGHVLARREKAWAVAAGFDLPAIVPQTSGALPEWQGKAVLAKAGVPIPAGWLATTVDEAATCAAHIGYPVVLKAQAAKLAHKTEAGGVILNLRDEGALRAAWDRLVDNVKRVQPDLELDGVLVEAMASRGVELVVGAKRDPEWGPVLLIGVGGVMVEALRDVRLLAADSDRTEIANAFRGLRAAKLLQGFRGAPPTDVEAAAEIAWRIGQLMIKEPRIREIDVNPILAHGVGEGATALDALIVTD
jgi:acyl-CoA synthetase (NDP forming)